MSSTHDDAGEPLPPDPSGPGRGGDPQGTASYIADLTTELARLARGARLEILAYLLDVAQLEASTSARRPGPKPRDG